MSNNTKTFNFFLFLYLSIILSTERERTMTIKWFSKDPPPPSTISNSWLKQHITHNKLGKEINLSSIVLSLYIMLNVIGSTRKIKKNNKGIQTKENMYSYFGQAKILYNISLSVLQIFFRSFSQSTFLITEHLPPPPL